MSTATAPIQSIAELVRKKPSKVIRAAIHGLQTHRDRDDFIIDMHTFGGVAFRNNGDHVCMGCLATCALQSLANVELTAGNIIGCDSRAAAIGVHKIEVYRFDSAVNALRFNDPKELYAACGLAEHEYRDLPSKAGIGTWLVDARPSRHALDRAINELTLFAETLEAAGY